MNFFGCYVGWERANNRTMDENRANWEIWNFKKGKGKNVGRDIWLPWDRILKTKVTISFSPIIYIYIYKRHLACELTWPFTKLNETLNEVKSSAFMSTWELNNPIIHILLSKDSYMAPNHTKSLWKQHYDFWKGIKIFWPCPSHVVWFFLIEREHEVSSFYTWKQSFALFSPDVGLSPALQISKTHGFDCDKK